MHKRLIETVTRQLAALGHLDLFST